MDLLLLDGFDECGKVCMVNITGRVVNLLSRYGRAMVVKDDCESDG